MGSGTIRYRKVIQVNTEGRPLGEGHKTKRDPRTIIVREGNGVVRILPSSKGDNDERPTKWSGTPKEFGGVRTFIEEVIYEKLM